MRALPPGAHAPGSPGWFSLLDFGEEVALAQDLQFAAVHLDVAAAVLAEDDLVAPGDGQGDALALVVELAGADGHDAAALRRMLGRFRQQYAARRHLLGLQH